MPYVSNAQRKMFNAKAKTSKKWKKMAARWNAHSKGQGKLPEHKK
jgi:hypothetical protein